MVKNKLVSAVNLALAASAASALAPDAALAQQQASTAAPSSGLDEVIVTGSRVRRVDAETASPVFVLDAATISQTGAITVGDLISRIPSIAGSAVNPALNNGGGFGESNIELRGLGAERTLILIDGKRINLVGASGAVDVNQIPLNLIDHVDVLKEGAGAIYGSDAIAGVVNFITKSHVDGLELTGDWGETSKHDGQHHNFGVVFGGGNEKLTFTAGANYNQQDELTMAKRAWSKYALYLYSGTFNHGGSSRTGTGRAYLDAGLQSQFGCSSVTRKAGAAGSAISDYRCFTGGDKFNYQPYNLNLTPQERGALFTKVNYKINDYAEVYTSIIYNHTHSGFQLAPLPFDANADQIVISKNSIYNPFGYDFGGGAAVGGVNPNYTLRLSALGDRRSDSVSASILTSSGVRGNVGNTGWKYDANFSYNRLDQTANVYGYLFFNQLQNAVGPSFIDPNNGPTCGTPSAPISGCIPANIFNLTAPGQAAALKNISAFYSTENKYTSKTASLDFNGPVFKLPAGDILADVGLNYTGLEGIFQTSSITEAQPPLYLNCQISQEACGGSSQGSYNVKEEYVELFVPVLANVTGAESLNFDLGVRHSDYSLFGSTTKSQFKVEYRPVKDLLVRGTYSQIYRAPSISDISAAPKANSPTLNDPCNGYRGTASALYPNLPAACAGVPTDGSFQEPNNQVTGLVTSNANLKPESGSVKTYGFVYDPSFARGLSVSVDYWDYEVNNLLTTLDPNYAIQQCATTGASEFCSLQHRYQSGVNAGQFIYFLQPTFNLGELKTDGVDFSVKYQIRNVAFGDFRVGDFNFTVDVTHLSSYKSTPAPGAATQQIAGTDNKQFGFYAKNRGTLGIGWTRDNVEALLTDRYIGDVSIPLTNYNFGTGVYGGYHLGSVQYFDLTAAYLIKQTNTKIRVGLLNMLDKDPPIGGINSFGTGSSDTDVTQYDTVGRRFFVGFTQKF